MPLINLVDLFTFP